MKRLKVNPLTAEAFAAFGDVIETSGHQSYEINYGMADCYHALATVDASTEQGFPVISLVDSKKYDLPQKVKIVERHPLGSQAFIPRDKTPFVVVVADASHQEKAGNEVKADQLHAFITNGEQGINYHAGTWHGLLLTPFAAMSFICVDRGGAGENCEEFHFPDQDQFTLDLNLTP